MTLGNAPTCVFALALALTLGVFFLEARTLEQLVNEPAVTWPAASVRTGGSEGRVHYYAVAHK